MLVVRRTEDPADPLGQLMSAEQSLGLDHFAFGVDPLGLYGVEPRALGRQQAGHYSYSGFATASFDLAVVGADPVAHLSAFVPACVVPDHQQGLLAPRLEPLAAPTEEPRGYGAHGATIHESQPRLLELRQIKPVAGEGLGLGIVLSRLLLEEAHRLACSQVCKLGLSKRENQVSSSKPKTHSGWVSASRISRSLSPFFGRTPDPGSRSISSPAPNGPPAATKSPGWSPP